MSKLNGFKKILASCEGSTLVAVVVFSIVFAIAGAGYMHVMTNTVSHEVTALDDERAYLAAESGLLKGLRFLRINSNWAAKTDGQHILNDTINDMVCSVYVEFTPGALVDTVHVRSLAWGGTLTYRKELSYAIHDTLLDVGTFFNDMSPDAKDVGGGGLNNNTFDGPVHSNVPIVMSSVSGGASAVAFNDKVTVHNRTDSVNFDKSEPDSGGHWGNYGVSTSEDGNDYEYGVFDHNLSQNTNQGEKLDQYFRSEYYHSQDSLYMPRLLGQDSILPSSFSLNDTTYIVYRADGSALYTYFGTSSTDTVRLTLPSIVVNNKVIRVKNHVGVLGKVNGRTTLVTDSSYSIIPLGDLTYADFTPDIQTYYDTYDNRNNFGVKDSPHLIALVSGDKIFFKQQQYEYNTTTQTLDLVALTDKKLFLTASLIAVEPGGGNWWVTKSGDIELNKYEYELYAIGDRIIDYYFSYGSGGSAANSMIRFYYDTRLTRDFRAPGVPHIVSGDVSAEGLRFLKGTWAEKNE